MQNRVNFNVDGEWLTDFIRSFYYAEDKTYDECKDKLCRSLCLNEFTEIEKDSLAKSVIFGEKKFIGLNSLDLVDDLDFDVYDYSRVPRPTNLKVGKGVTGILTTDGVFAECDYGGHYSLINFIATGENQKLADALIFSAGIPGDAETAYVQMDEPYRISKYQIRWYEKNIKYLNVRQKKHMERYLKKAAVYKF